MHSLFYVDPSTGKSFDYARLTADVAQITEVPSSFTANDIYETFVMLLAAIASDSQLALQAASSERRVTREGTSRLTATQRSSLGANASPINPAVANFGGERKKKEAGSERLEARGEHDSFRNENSRSAAERLLPISGNMLARLRDSHARIGIYTSGTTGRPKLIWHGMETLTRWVRLGERHAHDVWGFAYSPAHFAGLQVFFQALCNQNPLVRLFELDHVEIRQSIENYNITHLSATPTFFRMLCDGRHSHANIQAITLGGERLPSDLQAALKQTFPNARIRNIYASTEAGSILVAEGEEFSVSEEYAQYVRIVDGELCVHRDFTADSIRQGCDDAFYRTGDQVEVVSQKPLRFRITSRRSDWINVGGYKVNPHQLESLIAAYPRVAEVRVFGQPNSVTGNIVCCEIQVQDGEELDLPALKQNLRKQLARHEVPQIFKVVSKMEVTGTGKKKR